MGLFGPRCPDCNTKTLVSRNWIRATVVINGQRAPDSWTYYECEGCGARWKKFISNTGYDRPEWQKPSDEEWALHCQRGT